MKGGMLCLGTNKDGSLCSRRANRATGYCAWHENVGGKKEEPTPAPQLPVLVPKAEDQEQRTEDRECYVGSMSSLREKLMSITDLESLRRAELHIVAALMDGTIDSKSGGSIAQLLKHQADLIIKGRPKEELTGEDKAAVIEMTMKMPTSEMLTLLQDFSGGIARLAKKAKQQPAPTVDAEEVKVVEENNGQSGTTNDTVCEQPSGIPPARSTTDEIF